MPVQQLEVFARVALNGKPRGGTFVPKLATYRSLTNAARFTIVPRRATFVCNLTAAAITISCVFSILAMQFFIALMSRSTVHGSEEGKRFAF
jgi:hypothetical protein